MQGGRPLTPDTTPQNEDFENIIKHGYTPEQARSIFEAHGMKKSEVDELIDKIIDTRAAVKKTVKKFLGKIQRTYGDLEIPKLITKGIKHANKVGLSDAQRHLFLRYIKEGDRFGSYMPEKKSTTMARFLGNDRTLTPNVSIEPIEHSKLNELSMLYDATKHIHNDVKHSINMYFDCAYAAISGLYDKKRHNVNIAIHPIIAALFLPKINYIEDRMLVTNIARIVLSRSGAYLKDGAQFVNSGTTLHELTCDFDLANDIAYDPNAGDQFMNSTPLDNLIKRYRAQTELYQCVLNLRQGRYYGTEYGKDSGISGFLRIINTYEWTFFDSPDLYHVQDEGTILRKLLAIYSCRPTFIQLRSVVNSLTAAPLFDLSKTVFMNVPIINLRLPSNIVGANTQVNPPITLSQALSQTDTMIEHRQIVPKHKDVVFSNKVAFFYVNRRTPTINIGPRYNNPMILTFMNSPLPFNLNSGSINKTAVHSPATMPINNKQFNLRSVVTVNEPTQASNQDMSMSSTCGVFINYDDNASLFQTQRPPITYNKTLFYEPYRCATSWIDQTSQLPATYDPVEIDVQPGHPMNPIQTKLELGTIYVYTE
jgi:hypothetical protein